MTPGGGPAGAARPPKSLRPTPHLPWPYPADVARQLPGGFWHGPQPSLPWCLQMQHRVQFFRGDSKAAASCGIIGLRLEGP